MHEQNYRSTSAAQAHSIHNSVYMQPYFMHSEISKNTVVLILMSLLTSAWLCRTATPRGVHSRAMPVKPLCFHVLRASLCSGRTILRSLISRITLLQSACVLQIACIRVHRCGMCEHTAFMICMQPMLRAKMLSAMSVVRHIRQTEETHTCPDHDRAQDRPDVHTC